MRLSLDLGLGSVATLNAGVPYPPAGFIFLTEVEDGVTYYLIDTDGYYLLEAI